MQAMNPRDGLPLLRAVDPPEVVVHDDLEPCPYLPEREARMPLRLPLRTLTRFETDLRFEQGDRRHGAFLYRPHCPTCSECVAIRVPVAELKLSRTQRRTLRRGDALLRQELGEPLVDRERLQLYEKHKDLRKLLQPEGAPMTEKALRGFLVDRCCDAFEIRYYAGERLVAVAITDRGQRALSAVYTYYDPELSSLSLGTYSILKQVELCAKEGLSHLYLGLYVEGNAHMRYKKRFAPHELRVGGGWRRFDERA